MNIEKITRIYKEFVRRLPEQGMPDLGPNAGPQILTGPMVIRGNLILREEAALAYFETLETLYELIGADGTWNKDAVDNLLAKHVVAVASVPLEKRQDALAEQVKQFSEELKKDPEMWQTDLSVFGAGYDWNGLVFGKLTFLVDNVQSPLQLPGFIPANRDTAILFARLSVLAINRKSALEKAREIVEQHLAVLNALCADLIPSRTHLFHVGTPVRRFGMSRSMAATETDPELEFHSEANAVVLSRVDCDGFLRRRGGSRVSELLLSSNSFARRILSGLETAGDASVELRPHRAFLLYAIALESVVLGRQTQSEITYQLSARVAHLLGKDLETRRSVAKAINGLYGLRSKIVHTGETEVSHADLESIRFFTLNTLIVLSTSRPFAQMTSVDELEQWFKDRMLGAAEELG